MYSQKKLIKKDMPVNLSFTVGDSPDTAFNMHDISTIYTLGVRQGDGSPVLTGREI